MSTVLVETWTEAQRAEIADELAYVLADPRFATSQRCSALLQHLVEISLTGDSDRFKERTLGVEVFNRDPHYDTNADPIVRRIASETRKRLAQYYQDENVRHAVRIRIDPGGYLPHFEFESAKVLAENITGNASSNAAIDRPIADRPMLDRPKVHDLESISEVATQGRHNLVRKWAFFIATIVLIVGAAFTALRSDFWRSTDYLIWKPLLNSKGDLIVCVSDRPPALLTSALATAKDEAAKGLGANQEAALVDIATASRPRLKVMDVTSVLGISRHLYGFGKNISLVPSSSLNTRNLGNGPIILIGGINYPLSMMVESQLRFRFRNGGPKGERWIEDSQDPSKKDWKILGTPEQSNVDYAMVTRIWDHDTGGWVMMVCGIGPFGTEAAVHLVTDPSTSRLLPASIRSASNFQIVLKTVVIDGTAGVPQVLAVHTW